MKLGTRPVAALAAALAVIASACSSDSDDRRKANPFEVAYASLAVKLRGPEVCEKIHRRAKLAGGWGGEGQQIAYTRSDCYLALALETGDARHCAQVREAEHWWLDGSEVSEAACLRDVARGDEPMPPGGDPEWVLRFMGFSADEESDLAWIELYHELDAEELRQRAALLPDFSGSRGPVPAGVRSRKLGCQGERDPAWYCYADRCLDSSDEALREACLEIAAFLQTLQRERALGNEFPASPRVLQLLRDRPSLRTFELP